MRRWLLLAVLALLIADAGGLTAFAETEACALTSTTDRGPDGTCPTFCVRCGCCATPNLHSVLDVVATFIPPVVALPQAATTGLPSAMGSEILHVPKLRLA